MSKNEIEPQVGDIWSTPHQCRTIKCCLGECYWMKSNEDKHPMTFHKSELIELVERDGKRDNELWKQFEYGCYPESHKDALQKHWDDGKVIEFRMDSSKNWHWTAMTDVDMPFVDRWKYRMVEKLREKALQAHWDNGKVLEFRMDITKNWVPMTDLDMQFPFVDRWQYRMVDECRVDPEESRQ